MGQPRRHPEISAALAAGGGVVLARDHPSMRRTLLREVERGSMSSPLPGVFTTAAAGQDPVVLAAVVCASRPNAVVTGWTAAALSFWPGRARLPVEALQMTTRHPVGWLRTSRAVVDPELVVNRGALRLTCPEVTALGLASRTRGESIFSALRSGTATPASLAAALDALPGRRGTTELRAAVRRAANNPFSGGEQQFQRFLRDEQLASFVGNKRVRVFGRAYLLDLADEERRVAIEFDSIAFHADRRAFEDDRRKHNDLEAAGWRVLHVTWRMLVDEPAEVVRRIRQLCAEVERLRGR